MCFPKIKGVESSIKFGFCVISRELLKSWIFQYKITIGFRFQIDQLWKLPKFAQKYKNHGRFNTFYFWEVHELSCPWFWVRKDNFEIPTPLTDLFWILDFLPQGGEKNWGIWGGPQGGGGRSEIPSGAARAVTGDHRSGAPMTQRQNAGDVRSGAPM